MKVLGKVVLPLKVSKLSGQAAIEMNQNLSIPNVANAVCPQLSIQGRFMAQRVEKLFRPLKKKSVMATILPSSAVSTS